MLEAPRHVDPDLDAPPSAQTWPRECVFKSLEPMLSRQRRRIAEASLQPWPASARARHHLVVHRRYTRAAMQHDGIVRAIARQGGGDHRPSDRAGLIDAIRERSGARMAALDRLEATQAPESARTAVPEITQWGSSGGNSA